MCGLTPVGDGPQFDAAEKELAAASDLLTDEMLVETDFRRSIYRLRANVGGDRHRIEITVSHLRRDEGPLDQIVRVRLKGR